MRVKSAKYARIRFDGAAERQPFGRYNYMLNVASYRNGVGADAWVCVSGFSEAVVDWMSAQEAAFG